jgi:hypothetical protein
LQNVIGPTPAATGGSIAGLSGRGASLSGLIKSIIYWLVGWEKKKKKKKESKKE